MLKSYEKNVLINNFPRWHFLSEFRLKFPIAAFVNKLYKLNLEINDLSGVLSVIQTEREI